MKIIIVITFTAILMSMSNSNLQDSMYSYILNESVRLGLLGLHLISTVT